MSSSFDIAAETAADALATIARLTEETRAIHQELETARREYAEERAETLDAQAESRRKGEEGRDWQVLQQRIDLRQTTLTDIVTGIDLSREAKAVREAMAKGLAEVRTQIASTVLHDPDMLEELQQAEVALRQAEREAQGADPLG